MDMEIDPPKAELQIKDDDLFIAAESGDASTFKSLSREQLSRALSLRNEDGRSLLHVATSSAQSEVCPLLSSLVPCLVAEELLGNERENNQCLESFLSLGLCWCYFNFFLTEIGQCCMIWIKLIPMSNEWIKIWNPNCKLVCLTELCASASDWLLGKKKEKDSKFCLFGRFLLLLIFEKGRSDLNWTK